MTFSKLIVLMTMILLQSFVVQANNRSDLDPTIGGVEFERSCAVCHGFQGRGNGVMADALKINPSDLTQLTKNNNGHFPFTRVYQVIEGSPRVGVHGSRDMPVWGDRYRKESQQYDADEYLYTRGLILELVIYLISIQEP